MTGWKENANQEYTKIKTSLWSHINKTGEILWDAQEMKTIMGCVYKTYSSRLETMYKYKQ